MSEYEVEIERTAAVAIARLPKPDRNRVLAKIQGLATVPRPHGCTKLTGMTDAYRVRVGNYRIVYVVDDGINIVTVTRVAHRREVYRRL